MILSEKAANPVKTVGDSKSRFVSMKPLDSINEP